MTDMVPDGPPVPLAALLCEGDPVDRLREIDLLLVRDEDTGEEYGVVARAWLDQQGLDQGRALRRVVVGVRSTPDEVARLIELARRLADEAVSAAAER